MAHLQSVDRTGGLAESKNIVLCILMHALYLLLSCMDLNLHALSLSNNFLKY